MFTNITWKEFIEYILFFTIAYYVIIGWLYKESVKQWFAGKKITGVTDTNREDLADDNDANLFTSCINELDAFFEKAKGRKWIKEELTYSLQKMFTKYVSLKNSSYEDTIQRIIILQTKDTCSVHFNAEDVSQLWLG